MPELPEVEVVKRSLTNKLKNLVIKKIKINDYRLRYPVNIKDIKSLIGLKIRKISRRSKYLIFFFKNNLAMLVHLGMSGKLFFINQKNINYKTSFYYDLNEEKDKKYNRVILTFSDNQKLVYNDVRKFGFIKVFDSDKIHLNSHISRLGPEPLSDKFNYFYLRKKIVKCKKNIKNFMMDQKYISGLGNIYVNEILFYSSINPRKIVNELSNEQVEKIVYNTKKTLKFSIQLGGSSIRDFNGISGQNGNFQQKFMVYDRDNKNCRKKRCEGSVIKIYISNRSTFFCQKCQSI
mgnify:CR=1 FL=1